ncbi:MAG: tRNA 5-methoxyuridine(34)/uridine 5-oxyacetic acid(34) synthase CmoB [Candidatus Eremiobacteraeota bacterium]|nr:tRNA 5-methoxyuridine(34)/uridine 5-oxyacetic acid(34) synthase CmoB [Candidatus Eremiobacteraeota bacterium]
MKAISPADLRERVDQYKWWHIMDLGQGVVTPGFYDPVGQEHAERFAVPKNLTGKTVLDVGCWDGAWSFEAKRRGAKRVLATDKFSWGHGGWGNRGAFLLAREALGLDVEDQIIDVMELSRDTVGQFDVVFFFGVVYHMRHPMLSLEKLRDVTAPGGLAIVETHCDMLDSKKPALAFYPADELLGDQGNWFGPNPEAMIGMLKSCGFTEVSVQSLQPEWQRMTLHAR